jgi:glutamate formiminotransferase / 5-formyltetrahydrofolate cyclo-ligase
VLESVVNISEGRAERRLAAIGASAGRALLDVHRDHDHHRSVFTVAAPDPGGTEAATRRLVDVACEDLDLREHVGVHPRLGIVDVVPFVALEPTPPDVAVAAAHAFGDWLARAHRVPVFFYGAASDAGRTLPDIRRDAFAGLTADRGPSAPDPRLGATAVGARPPLVAVNVELDTDDVDLARRIARETRERDGGLLGVRALGFPLASRGTVQVSMNLVDLAQTGIERSCSEVRDRARTLGVRAKAVELVGLLPEAELARCSAGFLAWAGISANDTVEGRARRRFA